MEPEFFAKEAEECTGLLYRVSYTLLHNDADCQDAVQEALLKAWAARNTLKNPLFFRTWLVRILINVSRDSLKRRGRALPLERVPEPTAACPDPSLADALARLPEKLRLPLTLYYSEQMSYRAISQTLHIPVTTVQSRLRQGKARLRKELKDDGL